MRALIQRVTHANAANSSSPHPPVASIGKGMLILVGFKQEDTPVCIEQMTQKIRSLRIFADKEGKMNLAGHEVGAEYLLVSQFTLYAEMKYGNRPSFVGAAEKGKAKEYFEHFVAAAQRTMGSDRVRHTEFGSDLEIELVNEGPVSFLLDSDDIF